MNKERRGGQTEVGSVRLKSLSVNAKLHELQKHEAKAIVGKETI